MLRTENLERDLPDREDYDDLKWQTLDDRLPDAFASSPGARKFMQQIVENDKLVSEEFIELNTEDPAVTASGTKLKSMTVKRLKLSEAVHLTSVCK